MSSSSSSGGRLAGKTALTRTQIEAIFARRIKDHQNLDVEGLLADYADNCVVESPTGGTHTGRAAIKKTIQAWFDGFPDLKIKTDGLYIDGNNVTWVMTVEGTDVGGFLGVPATGKRFKIPIVFLYEFKGRKIVRERRVYDFTGLLVQIGVLKAKPV
jgi:steroid delta-isomerase-like uncharacterized protein